MLGFFYIFLSFDLLLLFLQLRFLFHKSNTNYGLILFEYDCLIGVLKVLNCESWFPYISCNIPESRNGWHTMKKIRNRSGFGWFLRLKDKEDLAVDNTLKLYSLASLPYIKVLAANPVANSLWPIHNIWDIKPIKAAFSIKAVQVLAKNFAFRPR